MSQQPLFFEGIEEAAEEIARCYPEGPKALAHRLRPNKSVSAAHTWWLDCCNPKRTEHNFNGEDWLALMKIGREINCHAFMHWLCDEANYKRAEPKQPENELARRVRLHQQDVARVARDSAELTQLLLNANLNGGAEK